jgi:ArsR family transcriptional regulator, arsenate/arsenite/antimonite-responsive transcriptional repressor
MEMEKILRGLADATRLRIVNLLSWGELCGCDIQRVLHASQSNVSRHLVYLKHAGLVLDRREGFRVFYRLVPAENESLTILFQFLRTAFRRDESFRSDLLRLKDAIKDGACQAPPRRAGRRASPASRAAGLHPSRKDRTGPFPVLPGAGP